MREKVADLGLEDTQRSLASWAGFEQAIETHDGNRGSAHLQKVARVPEVAFIWTIVVDSKSGIGTLHLVRAGRSEFLARNNSWAHNRRCI